MAGFGGIIISFLILLWCLIGFLWFVYFFAKDEGNVSVGTILFSFIGCFMGPIVLAIELTRSDIFSKFLTTKIWERKTK
jgi:hypothetical protein